MAGAGLALLIVKMAGLELLPPGLGLRTTTFALPGLAIHLVATCPVSWVLLTYVVLMPWPFMATEEPDTKLLPLTVIVKAAPPAVALAGEIEEIAAIGLEFVTVNGDAPEVPPPGKGLNTVTLNVPGTATSTVGICAEITVLLLYVVGIATPDQYTMELDTKLVPFTVSVNPV